MLVRYSKRNTEEPDMSTKEEAPTRTEIIPQADTHHGLPLLPHPSEDERDPLRWSRSLKLGSLIVTSFFNFTANFASAGLSVATVVLEHQFSKTPNQVNSLLTVNAEPLHPPYVLLSPTEIQ